ncbi:MAG: DUF692 family protein, partial [Nannocystaceae bacterium]
RDLRGFLDALGAARHSDHLCWTGAAGRCLHDLLPLPVDRALVPALVDRMRRVQDLLGRPFAVENISYYGAPGWSPSESAAMGMAERELLVELLDRAQCGLLLDVNNVLVNATNHGFDPYAYLAGLDLDRVVQLHVAGGERIGRFDDLVIDTHGTSVSAEVEALMAWVIERTGPLPVIYERDNNIPPLAELAAEVERLQRSYDAALERRRRAAPLDAAATPRQPAPVRDIGPIAALQDRFARRVLDLSTDAAAAPPSPAERALAAMGERRLGVYRGLIRGSIHRLLDNLLPRTLARLGDAGERWVDRWLADAGPRSRILRELVDEWVAWVVPRWRADPQVPSYLADLVRHEAVELAVDAAPPAEDPPAMSAAFDLERGLVFDPSARLERYDHAIHRLSAAVDDRTTPPAEATALLIYRDRDHDVRFLHLTPLAAAVVEALLCGAPVRGALLDGAAAAGQPLDDAVLARMSRLLADLAERGIVRGSVA